MCVCVWRGGGGGVISQMSDTTEPPILTVLILPDSLQIQFNSLVPKECLFYSHLRVINEQVLIRQVHLRKGNDVASLVPRPSHAPVGNIAEKGGSGK